MALWARRRTAPWWAIGTVVALGSLVVTVAMVSVPGRSAAYVTYFVWLGIFAFYFLRPRWALAQTAWIAALYAIAVVLDDQRGAIELWVNGVATTLGVGLLVLALRTRITVLVGRLELTARTDPLTGLPNRRAFDERLAGELARLDRTEEVVALLILDLDHFKALNDTSGHLSGDDALGSSPTSSGRASAPSTGPPGSAATSSRSCSPAPTRRRRRGSPSGFGRASTVRSRTPRSRSPPASAARPGAGANRRRGAPRRGRPGPVRSEAPRRRRRPVPLPGDCLSRVPTRGECDDRGVSDTAAIPLSPEDKAILDLECSWIAGHTCKLVQLGGGAPGSTICAG